jgi:NTP pyrophosphatase (non-canonical NTP hydrolase)
MNTDTTLNLFQSDALRTAKYSLSGLVGSETDLAHAALGLTSEAGEVATAIKANIIYGKPLDVDNIKEELGDILWFVAFTADVLGFTLEDVATSNIAKLRKRYPDDYSDELALARLDKISKVISDLQAE